MLANVKSQVAIRFVSPDSASPILVNTLNICSFNLSASPSLISNVTTIDMMRLIYSIKNRSLVNYEAILYISIVISMVVTLLISDGEADKLKEHIFKVLTKIGLALSGDTNLILDSSH